MKYGITNMFSNFSDAVESVDIVSLHIPANKDTANFLDDDRLQVLKPSAIIINTGRGSLMMNMRFTIF